AAMPVELHRGAEVNAQYHVRWPRDAKPRVGDAHVAPMDLHYVRIEQEQRPKTLLGFYKRQAGKARIDEQTEGTHLDGFVVNRDNGLRTSIDIYIYNAGSNAFAAGGIGTGMGGRGFEGGGRGYDSGGRGGEAEAGANDPRDLVVEILTITLPPATAPPKSDADPAS
ncbi:MAG: hypothetical protein KDA99_17520, partial [Planctomycetales bacterium]|nr:hypothetical protein [Planctomycetales bacterium]